MTSTEMIYDIALIVLAAYFYEVKYLFSKDKIDTRSFEADSFAFILFLPVTIRYFAFHCLSRSFRINFPLININSCRILFEKHAQFFSYRKLIPSNARGDTSKFVERR